MAVSTFHLVDIGNCNRSLCYLFVNKQKKKLIAKSRKNGIAFKRERTILFLRS